MLLNTPISADVWDVDSVRFRPQGRQSGLLRRSISISPASGSTVDRHLHLHAVLDAGERDGVVDVIARCACPAGSVRIVARIRSSL